MASDESEQAGDQAFRAGESDQNWPEMTYGGALSFLRRRYSRDLTGVDVAVSGIPFDAATSNRSGARLGPRAIRAASTGLAELASFPFGFDPLETIKVVDYGDCYLDFGYPQHVVDAVELHADTILESGASMLTFGGDHSVTYPLLRSHAKKHGMLSLVQFDAHSDTWPDDGTRLDHGSMFLRAAREGLIDPSRSVQIGVRTANESTFGFNILSAPWIHANGVDATVEQIVRIVADHRAYLTFDIDCLDPAFAPGTGTPVAGGLSSAQALGILRGLAGIDLVGADVVEVAPAYDHAEITALAAATVAYDYLCLVAVRAGAETKDMGPTFF